MKLQKKKGIQGKTKRKNKNTKGNRTKIHKTRDGHQMKGMWGEYGHPNLALTTWKPKANREIHQLFL